MLLARDMRRPHGWRGEWSEKFGAHERTRRSEHVRERSVKPSAQPTLVRTQHLPPRKSPGQAWFHLILPTGLGERCATPLQWPGLLQRVSIGPGHSDEP
jgi:hypothetical protein